MREMKDSGIRGIGQIPSNWDTQRIKYLFSLGKGLPITKADLIESGLPVISYGQIHSKKNNGTEIKKELLRYVDFDYERLYPSCEVFQYDFVFADTSEDYDGCGNCVYKRDDEKLFAGYHDVVLHSIYKQDNRYYAYLFQTDGWRRQIRESVSGVKVFSITQKTIGNTSLVMPPLGEQKQISDFLDSQCSKIDTISDEIQSEISILEQYKKAVITEAVTKGLNTNTEMKDSGIQWVGNIPNHWNIHPVYFYFGERKHKNSLCKEKNLLSLSYGSIIRKDINTNGGLLPESFNTYNIVESGDIIIRPTDLQNDKRSLRTGYVTEHGIITSAYIALKPIKKVNTKYFHYLLHCYDVMKVFYNMGNGVRQGLNYSEFAKLMVFEPPIEEQCEVVEYLENKCAEIDTVISQKKEQLVTLAEYKKSLIYEYVTGKKEVPTEDSSTVVALEPRMMLLGTIIDKLGNNQKGRIQLQKIMYLVDMHLGLNHNVQYYRYDHGPYDIHLNDYIDNMVRNGWYQHRNQGGTLLIAGKNHADFLNISKGMFADKETEISNLLNLLQSMNVLKRTRMERIATLYAAWNDFLLDGITPTDDQIIQEVMTNWTENKGHTKYETWQDSLNKMKTNGLIPKGVGLHTLPKLQKEVADNE